jgi:hypothetical protein
MTHFPRHVAVSILSAAVGFIACHMLRESNGSNTASATSVSTFESDALGFVNWYRIMGRESIPHEELTRNLQILETKAIASGKLISDHTPKKKAE